MTKMLAVAAVVAEPAFCCGYKRGNSHLELAVSSSCIMMDRSHLPFLLFFCHQLWLSHQVRDAVVCV